MSKNTIENYLQRIEKLFLQLNEITRQNLQNLVEENNQNLDAIKNSISSFKHLNTSALNEFEKFKKISEYHHNNFLLLESIYPEISENVIVQKLKSDLLHELETYENLDVAFLKIEYSPEYFSLMKENSFSSRFLSSVEQSFIKTKAFFIGTYYFIGKLFKIKRKAAYIPHHTLKTKLFLEQNIIPLYIDKTNEIIVEMRKSIAEKYKKLFLWEDELIKTKYDIEENVKDYKIEQAEFEKWNELLLQVYELSKHDLFYQIQKSGTIISPNFLKKNFTRNKADKATGNLSKEGDLWQSTFFALFEDWRLREQLYNFIHELNGIQFHTLDLLQSKIKKSLIGEVDKLINYTQNLLSSLPVPEESNKEKIRSFLVSQLYKLKKETLQKESEVVFTAKSIENIPNIIHKSEYEIVDKLEKLSERVGVVKNPDFKLGVTTNEIKYFSPVEFVQLECLPPFQKKNERLKEQLVESLKLVVAQFTDYDQIIDFYLDTSIALTEKDNATEIQIIQVVKEGLERLLKINQDVKEILEQLLNKNVTELSENMNALIEKLIRLDDNDNALNIYAQLLKVKTLKETKEKRAKFISLFKSVIIYFGKIIDNGIKKTQNIYFEIRRKLKLDVSASTVSSEISNYLTEIQHRIYELPVIYQHLFENTPVKEFNLFLSREEEMGKLKLAYNDWQKGNYAATLIEGESGSGKSSLLYYFSENFKSNYKITLKRIDDFYYLPEDYYRLMNEVFEQTDLKTDSEISAFIASLSEKRIIILDGFERLFLRKVNGFDCLHKILSLIVTTNAQIFWICSVSKIASDYLNKTIRISDYFDYNIQLDSLSGAQVKEIILKRNRLSGYQIKYLDDESKSIKDKGDEILNQKLLEDKFFTALNKFADTNISLSAYFWLEAIKKFEDNIIYISDFAIPEFNFLEKISSEKAYALLVVLLHSKISIELYAESTNMNYDKSRRILSVLREDAILIQKGDYYILNGILYRHVVRLLKNRNLIH